MFWDQTLLSEPCRTLSDKPELPKHYPQADNRSALEEVFC